MRPGPRRLGNTGAGLDLESVENTTVVGNLISGNNGLGLQVSGFGTDFEHNVFQGNLIGTDATGMIGLGNTDGGVVIANAIGNTFGGSGVGTGNIIAFNGGDGIDVTSSSPEASKQDEFTENSIFGNAGPGIKLGLGGTNQFQQPPNLTFSPSGGGSGTLSGSLVGGSPNATYVIEIFSDPTIPVVGQEQGKTFVHAETVVADGSALAPSL